LLWWQHGPRKRTAGERATERNVVHVLAVCPVKKHDLKPLERDTDYFAATRRIALRQPIASKLQADASNITMYLAVDPVLVSGMLEKRTTAAQDCVMRAVMVA
jgi:hypothetical protein